MKLKFMIFFAVIFSIIVTADYELTINADKINIPDVIQPLANEYRCNPTDSECADNPSDFCDVRNKDFILDQDYNFVFGVDICNDNRIVDCQGHKITGVREDFSFAVTNFGFDNIIIRNCNISKYDRPIQFYNSQFSEISNNHLHDNYKDRFTFSFTIWMEDSSQNTIQGNRLEDNTYAVGIIIVDSPNNNILSNTIEGGIYDAINMNDASNNLIDNNIVRNNGYGISLYESDNGPGSNFNVVSNNYIYYNDGRGIFSRDSRYNTYEHNKVEDNTKDGIYLESSNENTLRENTVLKNDDNGIWLYSSPGNTLDNNIVRENFFTGILFGTQSNSNILTDNFVTENGMSGISFVNSDTESVNRNIICYNPLSDFSLTNSNSNTGDENTCNNADGWNDEGTTGCTSPCTCVREGGIAYNSLFVLGGNPTARECCRGLNKIPASEPKTYQGIECNGIQYCPRTVGFTCTRTVCGDGVCEAPENKCNCIKDCCGEDRCDRLGWGCKDDSTKAYCSYDSWIKSWIRRTCFDLYYSGTPICGGMWTNEEDCPGQCVDGECV